MIPNGVHRIISAIAASPEIREAMLGDLDEEYQVRAERDGIGAANRWCWREAVRSLFGALRHSVPNMSATLTSVLPAMLWGSVIACLASVAVAAVTYPVTLYAPFDKAVVFTGLSIVARFVTSIMGGYEAARVGTKAPLWSAVAAGLLPTTVLFSIAALTIIPSQVGAMVLVSAVANILLVPGSLAGGILQQAQQRTNDPLSSPV
ncbi:MAG TPA: hypothetical protein VFK26_05965 [Gemmatimonadaceae bacterium]|jgi:hypothetical protein|nr:hypothetical protein [Gemmatimonadaceae bacterium]